MYTCQTVIDRKIEAPTSREGMHKYFPYFFILYFYTTFESIGLLATKYTLSYKI